MKKVRFGIMCEGVSFPKWQAEAITQALNINGVTCELLIFNSVLEKISNKKIIIRKLKGFKFKDFLWNVYYYSIKKKFKQTKLISLENELSGIDKISCSVNKKGKFSEYFRNDDIDSIKSKELDFILRFSFGIIRGEILNSTKYGVWSFHHGDEEKYRGGPPGFWEIFKKDNLSGFILQRLTNRLDGGIILKKGFVKTLLSYVENRDQIFLESSKFVSSLCIDIINDNTGVFFQKPSKTNSPIYFVPGNFNIIKYLLVNTYNKIKHLKRVFYIDFWNIGVVENSISSFLEDEKPDVNWYPLLGKSKFYADPFGVLDKEDVNKLHVFYESYNHKDKKPKGIIEWVSYKDGFSIESEVAFNFSNHLSYPYPIIYEDDLYLMPENYESNKISIYKSESFPKKWKLEKDLINNFPGVDSTIIEKDGLFWMFTGHKDNFPHHNLYIYYSKSLKSDWVAHPKNPVKTDVRSCRSAGTPFFYNKDLYRPSMDYSEKTEGKIIINKVTILTKVDFKETPFKIVYPYKNSSYPDKIHTISSVGDYTIIDGANEMFILKSWVLFKFRYLNIFNKFKNKFVNSN